jgi:hypothetical protein
MKKLVILIIIPFLSFGQCVEGDLDNDGICDEIDNCVGTWIANITTGNCNQFTSEGADFCNSYSGCEWTYSWGGWVTGGSSDCLGTYEVDNGYCDELDLNTTVLCDSIFVSLIEYNEVGGYIEIEVSTEFLTSYSYPYAGFLLTNSQGDTIASETLGTAGNVYGLSGGMLETRMLQITNELSLPFNGVIYLMNFLFAGSPELACSWPFVISENLLMTETLKPKKLIKTIDVLGKNTNKINFQLHIYDDSSIEKKYLIK